MQEFGAIFCIFCCFFPFLGIYVIFHNLSKAYSNGPKCTKCIYIHSIYIVKAQNLQKCRFIIWVSYGYVVGILWSDKYFYSIFDVFGESKDLCGKRKEVGKENFFIGKFAHIKNYLYLCVRF